MFENTTCFIIIQEENEDLEIKRLNLNREGQKSLCNIFTEATSSILSEATEIINFDVGYKPENYEVQKISSYRIEQSILEALRDPISVEAFDPINKECPNIKAVFTGVTEPEILISFQRFNKSQYLTNRGLSLLHLNGTLKKVNEFGISINTQVDCIFKDNSLLFKSYYNARQVFDLSSYYRCATNNDVRVFLSDEKICGGNTEEFIEKADEWVRKKIALILDSEVLQKYSIDEIVGTAEDCNVDICVSDNNGLKSIILPEEKREMKQVLKFLDEDIYKGPLSNITYETNSKRKLMASNG